MPSCPFKVGDLVVFTDRSKKAGFPGKHGLPNVGQTVKVIEIVNDAYLRWEGMADFPGGALHWSEFDAANPSASTRGCYSSN